MEIIKMNFIKMDILIFVVEFDYVSVSSGQLKNTKKFAILIVTKENGCAVKFANKPKT